MNAFHVVLRIIFAKQTCPDSVRRLRSRNDFIVCSFVTCIDVCTGQNFSFLLCPWCQEKWTHMGTSWGCLTLSSTPTASAAPHGPGTCSWSPGVLPGPVALKPSWEQELQGYVAKMHDVTEDQAPDLLCGWSMSHTEIHKTLGHWGSFSGFLSFYCFTLATPLAPLRPLESGS